MPYVCYLKGSSSSINDNTIQTVTIKPTRRVTMRFAELNALLLLGILFIATSTHCELLRPTRQPCNAERIMIMPDDARETRALKLQVSQPTFNPPEVCGALVRGHHCYQPTNLRAAHVPMTQRCLAEELCLISPEVDHLY